MRMPGSRCHPANPKPTCSTSLRSRVLTSTEGICLSSRRLRTLLLSAEEELVSLMLEDSGAEAPFSAEPTQSEMLARSSGMHSRSG